MDKTWVDSKNNELREKMCNKEKEIRRFIQDATVFSDEKKEKLFQILEDTKSNPMKNGIKLSLCLESDIFDLIEDGTAKYFSEYRELNDKLKHLDIYAYIAWLKNPNRYNMYLDSEIMEFNNGIIITDPCYFMNDDSDDWEKCGCGSSLENLGIGNYMTRDTLWGDWSCSVIDTNTYDIIGGFGADSGLVTVADVEEVNEYNPNFLEWNRKHNWCATIIENFKGTVQFVVKKNGDGYCVEVVGHGIDKKTGKPIDFRSTQC